MADSHSSSASAKTREPIAWAVLDEYNNRHGVYPDQESAEFRLGWASMKSECNTFRVEPLYTGSSLAELVADSARLDWMQSQAEGQERAMRWWVRGALGATVHCCYDHTEPVKPEHETKFSRLFTEHSKPSLREAIDAARSLPETTDNG